MGSIRRNDDFSSLCQRTARSAPRKRDRFFDDSRNYSHLPTERCQVTIALLLFVDGASRRNGADGWGVRSGLQLCSRRRRLLHRLLFWNWHVGHARVLFQWLRDCVPYLVRRQRHSNRPSERRLRSVVGSALQNSQEILYA